MRFAKSTSQALAARVSLKYLANNAWLAGAGKRCILSDRFYCVTLYGVPLNHESKTEDFLFFFFLSVSRSNMVNMNAPSLSETLF
jgi:hypothetical protein